MPTTTLSLTGASNTYFKKVGQYPRYDKASGNWVVAPDETITEQQTRCWVGTDIHESDNTYWHLKAELTFDQLDLPENAVVTGVVFHIRVDGYGVSSNPRDVLVVAAPEDDSLAEPGETGHTVLGSFQVGPGMEGTWVSVPLSQFSQTVVLLGSGPNEDGRYCRLNLGAPHIPYVEVFYELLEPWAFSLYGSLLVGEPGSGGGVIEMPIGYVVYGSLHVNSFQSVPPTDEAIGFQVYGSLQVTQLPDIEVEQTFELPFELDVVEFKVLNQKYVKVLMGHEVNLVYGDDEAGQFGFKLYGSLRVISSGGEPPPGGDAKVTLTMPISVVAFADTWIDRNSLSLGRVTMDQLQTMSGSLSVTVNLAASWSQASEMSGGNIGLEGTGNLAASATLRATLELVSDD